ncbi:unnamed protein product [Spirodela intermedia]|uniref:WRKY domain-containing protein n=1 Tax=Spirodela intermedia TaxID=51605 RepID=A0A7I8JPA0_SPIIN|nr:unnamed protein product [Spirodela intermedia]CAA6671595.1 unnamed protein product [Spirodela intermedia]
MVGEGWDLRAVVEGFSGSTPMADPFSFPLPELEGWLREGEVAEKDEPLFCFPDQVAAHRAFQELEEFLRPFFPQPPPNQNQGSPCPSSSHSSPQKLHQIQHPQKKPTKRRKKQQKKVVCELPADFLSDDVWAWRKYGQKPIKGSPYPRGYYRCSSSKVCPARKQVERSRTNPEMFIITYTSEHNHEAPAHRNSHAGGAARPKSPPRFSATADKAPLSSPPRRWRFSGHSAAATAAGRRGGGGGPCRGRRGRVGGLRIYGLGSADRRRQLVSRRRLPRRFRRRPLRPLRLRVSAVDRRQLTAAAERMGN